MRYPNGDETRKEKPHDYRRYYPTHFLPRGHFFAGDSATSTGEAVSERISHNCSGPQKLDGFWSILRGGLIGLS